MAYTGGLEMLPKYSVAEINSYIKGTFDTNPLLDSVIICGEISNFSNHYKSGHLYFSLKDENSQLKAVMFSHDAATLSFKPESGMKVLALGKINVFERDGIYQLYVRRMQPDGDGALAAAFEQLKKKLAAEGLFDESRKKPIPAMPKRVGVITSPTGAAVQDIFTTLKRRFPLARVVFEPVSVQGAKAAWELKTAIEKFSAANCVDTIIIGRGGGSAEDLWCFNDEMLARAIYNCPIPVISAVGHETDFTICDFVADKRAATPTAAAELAVPEIDGLIYEASQYHDRLYSAYRNSLCLKKSRLDALLAKRNFSDPGHFFDSEKYTVSLLSQKLDNAGKHLVPDRKNKLDNLTGRLATLNPLSVLLRGYSAVEQNGTIISSTDGINAGDTINVKMSDGTLLCEVKDKWQK